MKRELNSKRCGGGGFEKFSVDYETRKTLRGFSLTSLTGEFDSGSERTLAACLTHASRTDIL